MCGIVGCIGHENAPEFVANGLRELEYRGYDSAGLAFLDESTSIQISKTVGGVDQLLRIVPEEASESTVAIGHTRWATHGRVTTQNAHPHTNSDGTITVVHNGAIENHSDLKAELSADGYTFNSQTDTEVIPHLIDKYLRSGQDPDEAFTSAINRLRGAYAVLGLLKQDPEALYVARISSPLVVGVNEAEHFAASDPSVIIDKTKQMVFLEDEDIFRITADGFANWHAKNGSQSTRNPIDVDTEYEKATLGEFPHYMLKEIHDTPSVVRSAISGRIFPEENMVVLGGLDDLATKEKLRRTNRIIIVACGTSYHAGLIGEQLIEEVAGIPVEVHLASEFKYREEPYNSDTAVLAVSQSGETADTIAALEKAKEYGMLTLGLNNTAGSTIDRMTDAGVHVRAGKEVSVASTKAFVSQVTVMAEIALSLAQHGNKLTHPLMEALSSLPEQIEEVLASSDKIEWLAKKYKNYKNFLYIGRGYEHPSALEGALKLKEVSYIHAEGVSAGEMKHGTLALIDEDFPTLAIATNSRVLDKTMSNREEIKARGGPVLAIANEGNQEIANIADNVIYVPQTMEQLQPVVNAVAMQLFAYHIAAEKGLNIDRPRNLAKSVTVE